jgi:urease gamma subunit
MPLYDNALYLIRANLEEIKRGGRVRAVVIGRLTDAQHEAVNEHRAAAGLPALEDPEVVFIGKHVYDSRIARDGYTVDDVVAQIASVMAADAVVTPSAKMTALESATRREDGYGNMVRDRAVLELTQRKPRAELYSVIPKGDTNKPPAR